MATKRTVLSQTERAFWRDDFKGIHQTLVGRYGARRKPQLLAEEAALHADAAVEQLRRRIHSWSRS